MTVESDIHEWLDGLDGSEFVVPVEASKFVAQADDKELRAWLWERREQIVIERMGDILRSRRSVATARRGSRSFAAAAENGDVTEFVSLLDTAFVVDDGETRRPLRVMNRDDLEFVACSYSSRARANAFEASFMRAVKRRVPAGKVVGDVFTDEQLVIARRW